VPGIRIQFKLDGSGSAGTVNLHLKLELAMMISLIVNFEKLNFLLRRRVRNAALYGVRSDSPNYRRPGPSGLFLAPPVDCQGNSTPSH
jgi:hypothetical protein